MKKLRKRTRILGPVALAAVTLGGSLHYINRNRERPITIHALITDIKREYFGEEAVKSFDLEAVVAEAKKNPGRVQIFHSDLGEKQRFVVYMTTKEGWCAYCKQLENTGWPQNIIDRLGESRYGNVGLVQYNLIREDPLLDNFPGVPRIMFYKKQGNNLIFNEELKDCSNALDDTLKILDKKSE